MGRKKSHFSVTIVFVSLVFAGGIRLGYENISVNVLRGLLQSWNIN
jgi:hypothetical protein